MDRDLASFAIAIVGMAGRFPGSSDLREFWRNLRDGIESIRFFTPPELRAAGVPDELIRDRDYVPAVGFLEGIDMFDADFFGTPPREAEITDPQHRLLLEYAWGALEDAGCVPETFPGSIGVFAGVGQSTYLIRNLLANDAVLRGAGELNLLLATNKDFAPLRVSYKLGLKGPSVNVNTACSSGLVAVHLACQSLVDYQCELALAGGAGIQVPQTGYRYEINGISSPDGHCRAFDAKAAGTVHGNGVGLVALKRLGDAIEARDHIYAVILGSAINNDGGDKVGFTAPSVAGQSHVIAEALAIAGCEPDSISYVETHGTGTPVGDPVEIAALTQAFGETLRKGYCAIGSLKTNVGHLDEAAGVAGLIKTALALEHKQIPPSVHYASPNPEIDFANSPFFVNTGLVDWPNQSPRRAAVSSFGIGGTNAHAVLEEAPEAHSSESREWQLLAISARTASALAASARRLADWIREETAASLPDAAYTLQCGRRAFSQRRAIICRDHHEAMRAMAGELPQRVAAGVKPDATPRVAFLFSGQGSQYLGMGRDLYRSEPVFREEFDGCSVRLKDSLGFDLCDLLFYKQTSDENEARLRDTAIAQPALFAFEYALARLWMSFGVMPDCMAGHSLGEYVASHLAGVFSLEGALALIVERGRLMRQMPRGAMLSVRIAERQLQPLLNGALTIAVRNAPDLLVVAGAESAILDLETLLSADGVSSQRLQTSHAFHSPMMDPAVAPFQSQVAKVRLAPPRIRFVSNVTGDWMSDGDATDPSYFSRHLRNPVRFSESLFKLAEDPSLILLEVGPGHALTSVARRHPAWLDRRVIPSGCRPNDCDGDSAALLQALGQLWADGVAVDWNGFQKNEKRCKLSLPGHPFDRRRYWIDPPSARSTAQPVIDGWFHIPEWHIVPDAPQARSKHRWLIVGPNDARTDDVESALRRTSRSVERASAEQLDALDHRPDRIVLVSDASGDCDLRPLLFLTRALARTESANLQLVVLTENAYAIRGSESVNPAQAAIIGGAQTIPLELPLLCRCIDLGSGESPDAVAAELNSDSMDPLIGIRNGARYRRAFEPKRVEAAGIAPVLKKGGVYLITGGLGSMGLAFARFLAREARARLVLVGRTCVPMQDQFTSVAGMVMETARRIESEYSPAPLSGDVIADLNLLCAAFVAGYLSTATTLHAGCSLDLPTLRRSLGVKTAFNRFFDYLLSILVEDGYARRTGESLQLLRSVPSSSDLLPAIHAKYPEMRGAIRLLQRCAGMYQPILGGATPGNQALYPDGSPDLLKECAAQTVAYSSSGVWLKVASAFVRSLSHNPISILEAGGGNGDLTTEMATALDGREVSYHFTDISQAFVAQAERAASNRGLTWMQFGVFDISRDPSAQGFRSQSYDVIVAYNVVHVAPRIGTALSNLRGLLKPGGYIILVETQSIQRWDLLCWGVMEDLWAFEDDPLRGRHPLLTARNWEQSLRAAGFEFSASFPGPDHGDTALIIGRAPGAANLVGKMERVREIEKLGAEVLLCQADASDRQQMENVCALARQRFGSINGVIHTAGVLRPGLISSKKLETIAAVLRPKVEALRWIEEFCDPGALDFLVLCSSSAAITPIAGQFDYAAANAYMDAFAHAASRRGLRATSINWNFWQEAGMIEQSSLSAEGKRALEDDIRAKGWTEAGIAAFARILLGFRGPQIVVSPDPLPAAAIYSGTQVRTVGHPLVATRIDVPSPLIAYSAQVSVSTHWEVRDHRPGGVAVLPGTAYLEIALTAFQDVTGSESAELTEVYFLTPMMFDEHGSREVRTIFKPRDDAYRFFIISRESRDRDEWLEHATGTIQRLPELTGPIRIEPLTFAESIDFAREPYHPLAVRQRGFPLRWRCLTGMEIAKAGMLVHTALPDQVRGEQGMYWLHPSLLDITVGAAAMQNAFEDGLPFSYGKIRVYRRLPSSCRATCLYRNRDQADSFTLDIRISDPDGNVCVEMENYSMRRPGGHASHAFDPRTWDRRQTGEERLNGQGSALTTDDRNYALVMSSTGSFAGLQLCTQNRPEPGRRQVEIEVGMAGLNFIEVLFALGMLRQFETQSPARFGLECAGRVVRVGHDVERFCPGDEVMAFCESSFSRYAIAEERAVVRKPSRFDMAAAATIPAAFSTAYYALVNRAALRPGERVLIHAAAGGVGLASVQVAQWIGAEIFATAGNDEKRERLRAAGVPHVMDSRTLDFASQIQTLTEGRGVDVVLNSLTGDFLTRSLDCLAPYGRFLEIGKREFSSGRLLNMAPFAKRLSFFAIDVGTDLPGFEDLWREVAEHVEAGHFGPLPYTVFPLASVGAAFEHMAQARHFGKIVIDVQHGVHSQHSSKRAERALSAIVGINIAPQPSRAVQTDGLAPAAAPSMSHERPTLATAFSAPASATEKSIARIWEDLLGIEPVGAHDNFFELRGDSLLAAQVTSRICRDFEINIPLSAVLEWPTVAKLAAYVDRRCDTARAMAAPSGSIRESEEEGAV